MPDHNHATGCKAPDPHCWRYRDCERCARHRQSEIADRAQVLYSLTGELSMHTIMCSSTDPAKMTAALRSVVSQLRGAPGIYSIETAPDSKDLHAHLITTPAVAQSVKNGRVEHATITTNPRRAGAYIAKRAQMPSSQQYPGRLTGCIGSVTEHLLRGSREWPIRALVIEHVAKTLNPIPDWLERLDYDLASGTLTSNQQLARILPTLPHLARLLRAHRRDRDALAAALETE